MVEPEQFVNALYNPHRGGRDSALDNAYLEVLTSLIQDGLECPLQKMATIQTGDNDAHKRTIRGPWIIDRGNCRAGHGLNRRPCGAGGSFNASRSRISVVTRAFINSEIAR
jgi:hypothetical protein